ncbi:type IV pilus twitching motility protein PilT [Campylobacter showae]|uniref:type IV pilus twitching motility protein PilT n=1 Tax=Campylobacter showae TaxID=204 RepID=UPI0015593BD6|nr:PilT/PilU family type 4a pilus ATPase [Campylobacter showae]
MKPLRFTSVNEEDVKDYEPVGSSIKFDSQDDALERIIKLKAKVLRSDIEHHRNKNKENSHEDEQEVVPLKADDAVREEVALQPKPKFEEIGGFDDLPKLKPIDDELAKEEEQEEPVKIDKFDAFSAPAELESKRQELNENLQAINEALNEIDALDEIPEQIDEIDEEAIFVAWKEPQIEKDTQEIGEFDKESEKSAEPVEETVAKEQTPNEKDQLLDFLRDEFSSVELEEDEPDNGDKFDVSQSDQDKFDTEDDEDFQSKFDSIKNEFDIAKNEINSGQTQSNLSADFWDVPQSKELEDKDFLKIDEHADLSEPEEQILEPNLRQTQEETSKGVEQVQTINDTQENRINTVKEPEARPVRRRDRAALLAELGLTMEEEAFGMSIRPPMPQDDDESEKRAAMKAVLDGYLMKLIELGGSDLHVKSDRVVRGRFNGEMVVMGDTVLDYDRSILIAKEILGANYYSLMKRKSVDFTYRLNDDYRFRSNVFLQMDGISFVFRTIPTKIPTMSELLLPPVIEKLCDKVNRGIILVTGPTGSGKTTTLASMINYLNHTKNYHIVTIEDPIEFIYSDDKSVINQRGIGQDVDSFADALRASLREDPDVIFVGEMRDLETVRTAINAAETGHLVLATLHTLDAKETIGRVINMFPKEEQNRVRMTFASVAEAIISQRLVVTTGNKRRVACEIMIKNIRIRDMILEDRDSEIYDAIEQSRNTYQMQTFEQHLLDMYTSGIITKEEALKSAGRRENLDIKIKSADLAKKRAMVASIEEDAALLREFQSDVIALKDIK